MGATLVGTHGAANIVLFFEMSPPVGPPGRETSRRVRISPVSGLGQVFRFQQETRRRVISFSNLPTISAKERSLCGTEISESEEHTLAPIGNLSMHMIQFLADHSLLSTW
jgi:hypothetical protein